MADIKVGQIVQKRAYRAFGICRQPASRPGLIHQTIGWLFMMQNRIAAAAQPAKRGFVTSIAERHPVKIASGPGGFMLHHIYYGRRQRHHRQR